MIVLLGDVGTPNGAYHLGDEAMLEAALDALRSRGLTDVTVISSDAASSSERYAVPSIGRIGFAGLDDGAQVSRLGAVVATAVGERDLLPPTDPAHAVIAAVAASDGVVITGGGNLSVHWPEHILERLALARIAATFGRPVVMTGQMVGPQLDERTGSFVAELIATATLIGVRDAESRETVHRLVGDRPVALLPDDAAMLGADEDQLDGTADGPVVATIAPWLGGLPMADVVSGIAAHLSIMSDTAGQDVVFVPHVGTLGRADDGDSALHQLIMDQLGHGTHAPLEPAAVAAKRHRSASFTFSTRYHPVVFAASGGRPVIAAAVDDYTGTKLRGALSFVGASDAFMPLGAVGTRAAQELVLDIWRSRERVKEVALTRAAEVARARDSWWDAVAGLLTGSRSVTPLLSVEPGPQPPLVAAEVRSDLDRLSRPLLAAGTEHGMQTAGRAAYESRVTRAEDDRDAAQKALADTLVELQHRDESVRELEDALAAAYRVQTALADPALRRSLSRNVERYIPPSTIEALLDTRSFRWSRGARRVVGSVRRLTGRAR